MHMNSMRRRVEERSRSLRIGIRAAGEVKKTKDNCPQLESVGLSNGNFGCVLRDMGHEAMRTGEVQTAVRLYSQSLHHKVTVPLLLNRADAYFKLSMCEDAVEDCTNVITLDPKSWRAYALRAAAHHKQGFFVEATADLREAKYLYPKRSNHFEKLRLKCRRMQDCVKRARNLEALIEEGSKLQPRPFVRGDKRITPAQLVLRMRECIADIAKVLEKPGLGFSIWKEDELDRWKRLRIKGMEAMMKSKQEEKSKSVKFYDTLVIVQRLEDLHYCLREGGNELRPLVGQSIQGFSTLLAAYGHQNLLVLEIIHQVLQDEDDIHVREFLRSQPLPILIQSFQDPMQAVRNVGCALLDVIASKRSQQILTILMRQNLIPSLLKSLHLGSPTEHTHSVSLLFKLSLDPRLQRYLSTLPTLLLNQLCEGLIRACRAAKLIIRLRAAQIISTLLELEKTNPSPNHKNNNLKAVVTVRVSTEETEACNKICNDEDHPSLFSTFANAGVLRAVAELLARESEKVPEKTDEGASVWEGDVELICEEIASTVTDFSEQRECTPRDFRFLSGYAQIVVYSAVQAVDSMAYANRAVEVLDQIQAWGLFVSLLSSFPDRLATLSIKALAKFCRRSKRVAMYVANLWPANSSLIVLKLARSAQRRGDSQTSQAAILILAELAVCKSFLASMRKPTSFDILFDFLQDGNYSCSTMALSAICTCMTVALTRCNSCVEYAEVKASALGNRLFQLWCAFRSQPQLRWQVENLMFVLMDRSFVLQQTILCLLENGKPCQAAESTSSRHDRSCLSYHGQQSQQIQVWNRNSRLATSLRDDANCAAERHQAFTQNRINFQKVCFFLSTLVQPSTQFADLLAGGGLLSIQVAKHFKEIHCYAVNSKRVWVEHTRRLAKQEAVSNVTAVLSKSFDLLPQTLLGRLDVAFLCFGLDVVQDFGLFFRAVRDKLQPGGKLVVIDDNEELVLEARIHASSFGFTAVLQSRIIVDQYFVLMLEHAPDPN